jgi:hypothetical protein
VTPEEGATVAPAPDDLVEPETMVQSGPAGPVPPAAAVDADVVTVATGTGDRAALVLVQRCAWTLVWVSTLGYALVYWGSWSAGLWAAVLAPVLVAVCLAGVIALWTVRAPLSRAMQWAGMSVALVTVAVTQGTFIHLRHFYSTDSAAFNQVATRLFLDGRNPYTSSMAGADRLLHPAYAFWTYQVDGIHTAKLSYPAGSFLLQAPFMGLGMHHMVSDWVDLGAWLVTGVLLFCMFPSFLRWLAPTLLLTGLFVGEFSSGGTDALFVPFLVLAVWRWDRFPGRAAPWLPAWVGPVSLGLACSVKQTPWFCVPFLLVGVAAEARRSGGRPGATALRYGAWAAGAFLAVNVVFIVWSPSAWLHGSLLPLVQPLVADGQGLVTFALHGITGGVVLTWLSVAAALAFVALLAAFAWWEPRLKRVWLFLVQVVLFLPARSLSDYLLDLMPAALVAALSVTTATSVRATHAGTGGRWLPRLSVAVPAGAMAVALVVAFATVPLTVTVDRYTAAGVATVDGGLHYVQVDVTVHNTSDRALTPRFMVTTGGGHPNGFWRATAVQGTSPVPAGGTTRFVLFPTRYTLAPDHGDRWIVLAYTTGPDALSTSSLQYWSPGLVQR